MASTAATEAKASDEAQDAPTLYTVAPELLEALNTVRELEGEYDRTVVEIRKVKTVNQPRVETLPGVLSKSARAVEALKKQFLGKIAPAEPKPIEIAERDENVRYQALSDKLAAIREAINLITQPQRGHSWSHLEKLRLEGSSRLCKLLLPEYDLIVHRVCAALVELGQAQVAHAEFMHRHRTAATSLLKPIQNFTMAGDAREPASELRRILDWAIEGGHFDPAAMPKEWLSKSRTNHREYSKPQR